MNYNEDQMKAIQSDSKKICCIAGAGSGKTATMLQRIMRIVSEGNNPKSILVLTFTRAAALNMKERYMQDVTTRNAPYFETFHALCYRLISKDSEVRKKLGYSKVPSVCDKNEYKKIMNEAKITTNTKLSDSALESKKFIDRRDVYQYKVFEKALKRLMVSKNVITFDDMCGNVCRLFEEDDECIQKYKKKYRYIFVDEFQDTDPIQWRFVQSFEEYSCIYVCGDALQAIYSFRNADSTIIKKLSTQEDWETIKIHTNYRSKSAIVDFANKNSTYADDDYRIEMSSDDWGGRVDIHYLDIRSTYGDIQREELDEILRIARKPNLGSKAILCRTNLEVQNVKHFLKSNGIQYQESHSNEDIPDILKAVQDNDYLVEWSASFLDSFQYANFLRWFIVDNKNTLDPQKYYELFSKNKNISSRLGIVMNIRRELLSENKTASEKLKSVLNILRLKHLDTDIDDETDNYGIIQYILSEFEGTMDSDVYVGTVHSVKGLEYDTVLLVGVNDSCWKLINEENNNLYYVGITRAKKQLIVFKYDGAA